MSGSDESMTVRYTAKELFQQVNASVTDLGKSVNEKLDVVLFKLEAKADHEALVNLEARVNALEATDDQRRGATSVQKAIIAILLAIAGMLVPIVVNVLG